MRTPPNQYLYNGKELQEEMDLNWYDYGARMYDPVVGRWNGVDVQAENYLPISPYTYVMNNPLIFVDPNGEEIWIILGDGSQIQYRDGKLWSNYKDKEEYSGDDDYASQVKESLTYLSFSESGAELINDLAGNSDFTVNIDFTRGTGVYEGDFGESSGTVSYNDRLGTRVYDSRSGEKIKGDQSPSMRLLHELGHADEHRQFIRENGKGNDKEKEFLNRGIYDPDMEEEEERVTRFETKVADQLNVTHPKLKENPNLKEGVRSSYGATGKVLRYTNPTPTGRIKKQKR